MMQLRVSILECFKSELLDMDMEEKSLEELITEVTQVKNQVEAKSRENRIFPKLVDGTP